MDQEDGVCFQAELLSAMTAEPSEELVQFYSKIRKLQVKISPCSRKNDGKDSYMHIYGNQGCYRSLFNSVYN